MRDGSSPGRTPTWNDGAASETVAGGDDIGGDDGAALAAHYEASIPDAERAANGQFYTPPALAAACCRWALPATGAGGTEDRDGPTGASGEGFTRVLDPAAGGGAFVVETVDRLCELGVPGTAARRRVTAVDVDGTALAVTRRRAGDVDLRECSFFDLDPVDTGRFDAVVGNPPFVRQESLQKDHVRAHLAAFGPEGATPYLDGDRAVDRRSDAYVYFLTNATRFLRPGGRLAMVVPTKWLATRYGETLQRFLLDHYRLEAVVGLDSRTFDAALVDVALVCLERRADPAERRDDEAQGRPTGARVDGGRQARFVRVDDEHSSEVLAAVLDGSADDDHRTVAVDRAVLAERAPGKLSHYLDAPPGAVELLEGDGLVPLGALASVTYGQKTGANDVFFLDADDPVAERFRAPAVTSFRELSGPVLGPGEAPAAVLDVHEYVADVLDGGDGRARDGDGRVGDDEGRARDEADAPARDDTAATVLAAMDADGYGATADYLRAAAEAGYADRTTCAARQVWFDLGPLDRPAVLHPKFFDERVAVVHNRAGAVPSNAVDCLQLREGVPTEALLGALYSSVYHLALECWGRSEGGGALQLMTYELRRVPAPDVRAFDPGERERVATAFEALVDDGGGSKTGDDADARRALDAAVLGAAGVDADPDRVVEMRETLVRRRIDGAGAARDAA